MSEYQALTNLLSRVARRLRLTRALREGVSCLSWLLAGLVAYRLLHAVIGSQAVMSALRLLFTLAGLAVIAWFTWRAMARVSLPRAAAAADTQAALNDELKTAYWFSTNSTRTAFVEVQLLRAHETVQRLRPREVVPIGLPRRAAIAVLALAAIAVALTWISPRWSASGLAAFAAGEPPTRSSLSRAQPAKRTDALTQGASEEMQQEVAEASRAAATADEHTQEGKPAQAGDPKHKPTGQRLEAVAALALPRRESDPGVRAPKAGEVKQPVQVGNEAIATTATSHSSAAAESDKSIGETTRTLENVLDQFTESKRSTQDGGGENAMEGGAEAKEKEGDSNKDAPVQQNITTGGQDQTEGAPVPAHGQRQTEASQGKGQGLPASGSSDAQGGPPPEFATLTTSGGAGSQKAKPGVEIKAKATEEQPTLIDTRLQGHLRRVEIEDRATDKSASAGDQYFAPTQARSAELDYQGGSARSRHVDEAGIDGERVPLAYRSAVKEYFLKLRQKEK